MKILVAFKAVADPEAATAGLPGPDAPRIINPFDAIAIEAALGLRESGQAESILAVTIGAAQIEDQIRAALAMGVDRAMRIDDERVLDPYAVARILRAVVDNEAPDLIIMGKQAIDDDCSQVGPMLAGLLGWPQATFVSKIEIAADQGTAECTRETDAGLQVVAVRLPAVITSDLRLNEPRYVSMAGLIKARRKPIECLASSDLAPDVQVMTNVLETQLAPTRPAGTIVESVDELIAKLRDEAKVL
jgi:electron transfer flavoprotein beta subunit